MIQALLPDGARILGRGKDTDDLHDLISDQSSRLILVTGAPRCGKTWLVKHLWRDLVENSWIVGYSVSTGCESDALTPAIAAAYVAWLSNATWRERGWALMGRHAGTYGPVSYTHLTLPTN